MQVNSGCMYIIRNRYDLLTVAHREKSVQAKNVVLCACLGLVILFVGAVGYIMFVRYSLIEGHMPSPSDAISIRADALNYAQAYPHDNPMTGKIPISIAKLHPLHIDVTESGTLIIFKRDFVEDYGYYYSFAGKGAPKDIQMFCKEIAPGVYRYYNPG